MSTTGGGPATAAVRARLGVVVVNYNGGELLTEAVTAVLASGIGVEVVVSDNGSSDGSLAHLRERLGGDHRLRVLENGANLGFARGSNRALALIDAPYVLFLNPDCVVGRGTLAHMLDFMDAAPGAGMAGCVIRDPDGSEQRASRRRIPDPWMALVRLLHLGRIWPRLAAERRLDLTDQPMPDGPVEVEAISGSLMLVRRAALDDVGPLDEGYFLHCEDLDWFVRFRRHGWGVYLLPGAEAVHHQGTCSRSAPLRVEWHKHRGMLRFYQKFQAADHHAVFNALVVCGVWAHFALLGGLWGLRRLWSARR
ncbi:dTDP-Rha--alpha-D-GlcNAc-pyrophosphate polyprenol alpha-3-L-rhamnosyltransferase [Thiohalocapsa halophila]|uniref:dTDP-Rha--alpha-D-GlcNAc-pyrophosphate polyprenol alpha-3-L-rhamnosyltransferase n=1 Tax=Thiohalocapsa halophila TaxID=69359 RepID=A0ABS1CKD1_9GAMM|nr:glycosyltransferase family 2 protein [Thiohalocapsa halophila]MBK1632376.1 dTDP-Rha--alpha-D-GlcNAc-pyrophosphate polyprenol alpha-3-L-rhamnosyltransferase [Thiohalocapsa halophila]